MTAWREQVRRAIVATPPPLVRAIVAAAAPALSLGLTRALRRVGRLQPEVFERLGAYGQCVFALEPSDIPIRFLMWPRAGRGEVRVFAPGEGPRADATARGSLAALVETALGERDADADVFARDLAITGNTAALVALRNTLEASGLNGADLIGAPEPLARLLARLGARRAAQDDETADQTSYKGAARSWAH